MDKLKEIIERYERFGVGLDDIDSLWLIKEVERLREARVQDLNDLAECFELTSRSSTDGPVFRHCAKIAQAMIQDIELEKRP
jgi:hypothetical protein